MGSIWDCTTRPLCHALAVIGALAALCLAAVLLSCGSGGGALPDGDDDAPAGFAELPAPSALRQVSYVPAGLVCCGANYLAGEGYPQQNVSPLDPCGELTPNWTAAAPDPAGLAYACYGFDLTDYDRSEQISFIWEQQGDPADLWIALADFTHDCWSWHSLGGGNILSLDFTNYVEPGTGRMLVLPLVTGTAMWQLKRIHVGDLTTVSGRVLADDGATPIEGTTVVVDGEQDYSAVTDYNGEWVVYGVLPGQYLASAHKIGWSFVPAPQEVTIGGLEQELADFSGTLLPAHVASGRVQEMSGHGVPNVEMRVVLIGSPAGMVSTWTDFDGNWSIELADGNYTVTPDLIAWTFNPDSRDFTVAGADVMVLPFAAQKLPGYLVDGYVYQADGTTPLADVQVNLTHTELPLFYTGMTDASGYWTTQDVIDGEYVVLPQLFGWQFAPPDRTVVVDGGELRVDPFIGTELGRFDVDGYIYLDDGVTPLSGVTVQLSGNCGWYSATTNSAGRYVFEDIYEDTYTAYPADICYTFAPENQVFTLAADTTLEPFLGTAVPTYQVDGYVVRPGGSTGIEGVTVTVYAYIPAGTTFEATTNASGYWRLTAVPAGYYTVLPEKQGFSFAPPDRALDLEDHNVTVDDFVGTELPSFMVHGYVYEGITPLAGVTMVVESANYSFETSTDEAGHWQLDTVYEDDYLVWPMLPPYQFTPNSRSITVSGGDVLVDQFVGVKLSATTVDGYIYETDSTTPVPDIDVWFYSGMLTYWVTTDATGHYAIPLPDANWEASPISTCWSFEPLTQIFTMAGAPLTLDVFYATPGG